MNLLLLKSVFLGLASFLVFLVAYFIIAFFCGGRQENEAKIIELQRRARLILLILSVSLLVYTIGWFKQPNQLDNLINWFTHFPELPGFLYGLFFYLLLAFIYLTGYYFIDRSISATLLELIADSPEEGLTLEEIQRGYSPGAKYRRELKGMLEGGFIIKQQDFYLNSRKGKLYAKMVRLAKQWLKLG